MTCLFSQEISELRHARQRGRHFEILLRMLDEDGNLVLPQSFIPAAERYDLMSAIDRESLCHAVAAEETESR